MVADMYLQGTEALGEHNDRSNLGTLFLNVLEAVVGQPLGPLLEFRDNVADQCWFFVTISSEESLAFADQGVSSQVGVDFVELNSEASNLDLTISSTSDGCVARVVEVVSKISSAVNSVAWSLVVLSPRLLGDIGNLVIGLDPNLVVDKPVVEELFAGLLRVIQISVRGMLVEVL